METLLESKRGPYSPPRPTYFLASEAQEYKLGSRFGRIATVLFFVGWGLIPFLVGKDQPTFVFVLIWEAVSLAGAWGAAKSPHIVRVGRYWAEFESLIGTQHARADEFISMVRNVLPSSRQLHHLDIELSYGSITVDGKEDVFKALMRMNPAVPWTEEEYDPPDD